MFYFPFIVCRHILVFFSLFQLEVNVQIEIVNIHRRAMFNSIMGKRKITFYKWGTMKLGHEYCQENNQ